MFLFFFFLVLILETLLIFIELFSFFSISGWGIDLNYCYLKRFALGKKFSFFGIDLDSCDKEWFALEMNRDHSVIFEISHKFCISDSFFDLEGYSMTSKGFFPTVVDIVVI